MRYLDIVFPTKIIDKQTYQIDNKKYIYLGRERKRLFDDQIFIMINESRLDEYDDYDYDDDDDDEFGRDQTK